MKSPIPLLIWSDTPSAPTGLARICRDLATRIALHLRDVFRVATVGYGASGSSKLPFQQYHWTFRNDWHMPELPEIWEDFSGGEKGVLFTIQDASRVLWLARPETGTDQRLRTWLEKKPFQLYGYFPMDATGPNNRLSLMLKECLMGYDRVLCYSEWARRIVENTLGEDQSRKRDLDQLPHGIDTSIFYPRPRARQRQMFGQMAVGKPVVIADDELLVGIVATNQARKDWALGIATCAELAKSRKVRIWMHTDVLERAWSIPYLLADFGLTGGNLISLGHFSDDVMARLYSACDLTLAIGLGEGFGFPIFESLACGTPCIHGDYGGAAEHLLNCYKIAPECYRYDGIYGCVRPVYNSEQWVRQSVLVSAVRSVVPSRLGWNALWPRWEAWLRKSSA